MGAGEEIDALAKDAAVVDDISAIRRRAVDLPVKHGVFEHVRGGLAPAPAFFSTWSAAASESGSMILSLMPALRAQAGGSLTSNEAVYMAANFVQPLSRTPLGKALGEEQRALRERVPHVHGAEDIRRRIAEARMEMEGRRL